MAGDLGNAVRNGGDNDSNKRRPAGIVCAI